MGYLYKINKPDQIEVGFDTVSELDAQGEQQFENVLFIRTPIKLPNNPDIYIWADYRGYIAEGPEGGYPIFAGKVGPGWVVEGDWPDWEEVSPGTDHSVAWKDAWMWIRQLVPSYRGVVPLQWNWETRQQSDPNATEPEPEPEEPEPEEPDPTVR